MTAKRARPVALALVAFTLVAPGRVVAQATADEPAPPPPGWQGNRPPPPPPRYAPPPYPYPYPYPPPPPVVVAPPPPPPLSTTAKILFAPFYGVGLVLRYGLYYLFVAPFEVLGRALTFGPSGGVERPAPPPPPAAAPESGS